MSGCGTRIVLRGQKPLALCDRCPCFGSLFPPLAALTFAASSIICAFGLASAAPRSPYRHLELCGIALTPLRDGSWAGIGNQNKQARVRRTANGYEVQLFTHGDDNVHEGLFDNTREGLKKARRAIRGHLGV